MLTKIYKLKTRKKYSFFKTVYIYMYEKINRCLEIHTRTEVLTRPDYENRAMHMERKIPCAGFPRCTHTNPLGTS